MRLSGKEQYRFDGFVTEVKAAATRHGIVLGGFQSIQLSGADYSIASCSTCGHLTAGRSRLRENVVPDFWFNVRRGHVVADGLVCDACEPLGRAA